MTKNIAPSATELETVIVKAQVTLTVAPKEGQTPAEAAEEMFLQFKEYVTLRDYTFLTDYGTTAEELAKFRAGDLDETPTWGGYEGPFVLEAAVTAVEEK